jgi:hypothetical protein
VKGCPTTTATMFFHMLHNCVPQGGPVKGCPQPLRPCPVKGCPTTTATICFNCKQHILKAALCRTTFLTICVACPAFKFVLGRRPTLHKLCALQNIMTIFTGRTYDTPRLYNRTNTYVATQQQTHIINCRNQTPPTNRCCQQCYGTLTCNDASHDYVYIMNHVVPTEHYNQSWVLIEGPWGPIGSHWHY